MRLQKAVQRLTRSFALTIVQVCEEEEEEEVTTNKQVADGWD